MHREGVHPLVDDRDDEAVAALPRDEDRIGVGDEFEVDSRLGILALDAVTDVLLAAEVAGPLDRDRQVALILMGRVGRLIEGSGPGADRVAGDGSLTAGRKHEQRPEAGKTSEKHQTPQNHARLQVRNDYAA